VDGSSDSIGAQKLAAVRDGRPETALTRVEPIPRMEAPVVQPIRAAMLMLLTALPLLAVAQSSPADEEPHHTPRPEALAACKDKSEGAACEFDAPKGHVTGTCRKTHANDLACMHPHHHDAGTP
jgi:hypothetical protein